jgi:hypothetical protein
MDRTCVNSDSIAHLLSEKVLAGGCRRASVRAARRLRLEDGLAAACAAIERLLKRARRPRVTLRNRFRFAPSVLRSYGTFGGVGKSVSFIVPCMGRLLHLQRTVRSVLAQPDSEYILVDWSCPEHSGDWVAKRFPEARVLRVPGKDRFHVSAARNLGAQAARSEWLAFLDVDMILRRGFLADARRLMRPGAFLVFPKTTPGYAGMLICRTSDFRMAGGYDEEMTDYGNEDMDLRERLSWLGLWQLYLSQSLARHIRHGDPQRVCFFAEKDKRKSERRNDLRGRANRLALLGLH